MGRLTVLMISVAIIASAIPAYSQMDVVPEQAEMSHATLSGEVVSVDLEKSLLTLKTMDATTAAEQDASVQVMPETVIAGADANLTLSDLKAGDKVEVEYVKDEAGSMQASIITVK